MNSKEITSNSKFFDLGSYSRYNVVESEVIVESVYINKLDIALVSLTAKFYS